MEVCCLSSFLGDLARDTFITDLKEKKRKLIAIRENSISVIS